MTKRHFEIAMFDTINDDRVIQRRHADSFAKAVAAARKLCGATPDLERYDVAITYHLTASDCKRGRK